MSVKAENKEEDKRPIFSDNTNVSIYVSMGTCGIAAGTEPVYQAIIQEVEKRGVQEKVQVVPTGCMGLCHSEPSIEVVDNATGESLIYGNVSSSQVPVILESGFNAAPSVKRIERNWYYPEDEENYNGVPGARIVLRNSGRIDPEKIDQYEATGGYKGLQKALNDMKPDEVIETILDSGLRGRGGGGFPTGKKWQFARSAESKDKYIICNADEGDPGAFMDRAVLEGDPHAVLEAMVIGGYAIGASEGIIYIRAEYPLAIKRLTVALKQARNKGYLGKNIMGSGFDFDIYIKYGAGAFVCGEETALIHSIEGKRGEPTYKPPFPAQSGLFHKPTIVNNVETLANIAAIIRKGAQWFKSIGTEDSAGTKVFALAGKISDVGLIEVPMGTTLESIVYDLGGGIKNKKKFKAIQTGGPSGGCITEANLKTPIDYGSLRKLGSMMGSGGMIVMDEDDCMVDIAKFYLEFTLDESCGKCTPCRIGNKRLHEMLTQITDGHGTEETLENLKTLSETIKDTSLCGLGQSSPNPVLSTIMNFEDEYREHIEDKKCRAGVCKNLFSYLITDDCIGCTMCARNCPVDCISGEKRGQHTIDQNDCIKCGVCFTNCKFHAINKVSYIAVNS